MPMLRDIAQSWRGSWGAGDVLTNPLPVAAQVARAARSLADFDDGFVLGYHPVARMNPYQALLYSQAFSMRFVPVGLINRSDFEALHVATTMGTNAALHLHWTSSVLGSATDQEDALSKTAKFLDEIRWLKENRVRIVWTVHNVLPHRCPFPEVETRLRAELAQVCDAIHIMAVDTLEATSRHFPLPAEKIFEVPHPSYVGAYPAHIDRDLARFELGFERSSLVLGAIGSIQPYKGLSEFALATEHLMQVDPQVRSVVAGIPGRDQESDGLVRELQRANHIDLIARKLTDAEFSTLITALDFMVLPYRASLNSGVALMALTFGVPIIAPEIGSFRRLLEEGLGVGYKPDDENGLWKALREARVRRGSFDDVKARRIAASLAGSVVSEQFFEKAKPLIS